MRRSSSSLSFPLLGFALLILLAACSRPLRSDSFRLSDGSGIYTFALDMSDSLCTYSLSFYASLDKGHAPQGFPIKVYLHSPSGATYCESLYYDASSELLVPYRRGLVPVEYGHWELELRASAPGLEGMGLVCDRAYESADF